MNIKYDYSGKNALVTGAATGMGKETALRFAKAGANVIVWDFDEKQGKATAKECEAFGVKSAFYNVDVSNEANVNDAKNKTLEEFGHVDFLFSNAGIAPKDGIPVFGEGFMDDFRKMLNVNALGFAIIIQAFLEHFKERKQGKVVVTSSIASTLNAAVLLGYGATKAAVANLMRNIAVILGPYNVNVNAIAPGFVYTPLYYTADKMIKDRMPPETFAGIDEPEEIVKAMAANSALGRIQTVEDMANAVLFLCSDEAKNITGQELFIDSGRSVI